MQKCGTHVRTRLIAFCMTLLFCTGAFAAQATELIPIGRTAGIKMTAAGVIIVQTETVKTALGELNPAAQAGLQAGDVILEINGQSVATNAELQKAISLSAGQPMQVKVMRGDEEKTLTASAVKSSDGVYKLGLMVRDSIAGIGTITYVDPETGAYGSLGHGICDSDTGVLVPLGEGSVMESSVDHVVKGEVGAPGSLQGEFNLQQDMGSVTDNTNVGIFGFLTDASYYENLNTVPVADPEQVQIGQATILANVSGEEVREYECEITKIYDENSEYGKCMVIHITDQDLIAQTGGIVQGMSGSPILQNGKLVGAVTHVLVNDPTRGYGIFAETMLEAADAA